MIDTTGRSTFPLLTVVVAVVAVTYGCRSPRDVPHPHPHAHPHPGADDTGPVAAATPADEDPVELPAAVDGAHAHEHAPVDLEPSFRIPQGAGGAVSHTPSVVFTADGKRMLSATSDGEIVVFDAATRSIVKRLKIDEKLGDVVDFDRRGRIAAWALAGGGLVVVDTESGRIVSRDDEVVARSVAVSPDGRFLAIAHEKGVGIRELAIPGHLRDVPGHDSPTTKLAWSSDNRLLGSTAKNGKLVVFDVAANRIAYETSKGAALYAIAFDAEGGRVAYGGEEKIVYQYDMNNGCEEVITTEEQPFWITCLGYSPDGRHIALGDESCDIWLYDLAANKRIFHNKHHVECWLDSVAWAADGETFLFGCRPNTHSQKPAVFGLLSQIEAARTDAVEESRRQLLRAIDDEIARTGVEKEKEALVAYKGSLSREGRVGGLHDSSIATAGGGWSGAFIDLDTPGVLSQTTFVSDTPVFLGFDSESPVPAAGTALDELPAAVRTLAETHRETLRSEMKKLDSSYCLNPWKLSKE